MTAPSENLAVGLGEMKISRSPDQVLVAYGLGSCLGIGMYDPVARVAGLLHAVLPERTNGADGASAKYVDSGIAALLNKLIEAGADRNRLIIKVAGGANILAAAGFKSLNIGDRNVAAAQATFSALKLKVKANDVGGNIGRTVRMFVANGRMTVRVIGNTEKEF